MLPPSTVGGRDCTFSFYLSSSISWVKAPSTADLAYASVVAVQPYVGFLHTNFSAFRPTIHPRQLLCDHADIPALDRTDRKGRRERVRDGRVDGCSGGPGGGLRRLPGDIPGRGMFILLGPTTRKGTLTSYSGSYGLHQDHLCCRHPCLSCVCHRRRHACLWLCRTGCAIGVRFISTSISTTTMSARSLSSSPSPPTPHPPRSGL